VTMKQNVKKIGVLAFLGDGHSGGICQYSQSLVDALATNTDQNIQYIIITDHNENFFDHYRLEIRKITRPKASLVVKITRLIQLYFKIKKPLFFSQDELAAYEDLDLFICPVISAYPHFYLNRPFIFTLHDLQERYYPEYFTLTTRIIRYVLNTVLSATSTHILCESNYVKTDIVKFLKQKATKISVIPAPPPSNLINFTFDNDKFATIVAKYQLPAKYLLYPAQFWYHKNHLKLLEAFKLITKQHDDLHLVLTGSKKNNYPNVIAKIQELELADKVLHLGYIAYEDLPYLYKMSAMLVMPTLFESISIPIYEAFALQVPVCASNVVALPEQVQDAGLLFDPNDTTDIANKIMQLLTDSQLRETIVAKGYAKILNFSHGKYKDQIIDIIRNLLPF